jgi:hypothetical protein
MPIIASLSALLSRVTRAGPARPKAAWAAQSHIDILADNLPRDREGWIVEPNAIRRNGVIITWTGPLTVAGTKVTVKMDGERFPVTPDETRKLKEKLTELLATQS